MFRGARPDGKKGRKNPGRLSDAEGSRKPEDAVLFWPEGSQFMIQLLALSMRGKGYGDDGF